VLDFAPLLQLNLWPANAIMKRLLDVFERETGTAVEIEFAATLPKRSDGIVRLAFLQVRPMMVSQERVDIPELTAALDVATCSSTGEGFPNTVGEAMACGVPLVVTDVGDCAILLGDAGAVVPPGQPRAFADALVRLLRLEPDERADLGQRARRRIEECYAIERIAEHYAALYRELVAAVPPAQARS